MTEVSSGAFFCLSVHADYACRHSGACCRTWEVAAEPHVVAFVRGRYDGAAGVFGRDAEDRGVRIKHADGACVFRQEERCLLHADGGEGALPVGCRHFPRIVLRDQRGTFITLSHYCPTAAALLAGDRQLDVVEPGASLRLCEPLEGLDARDALPPLLRPGMLMDVDAYDAWERSVIARFNRSQDAAEALAAVADATEQIRSWSPGRGCLRERVVDAFQSAKSEVRSKKSETVARELRLVADLSKGAVAHDAGFGLAAKWEEAGGNDPALQQIILRYLAARTLGNWIAYQGRGLRTVVSWLRACHDAVRVLALAEHHADGARLSVPVLLAAVRRTDLLMLHGLDSLAFARAAEAFEQRAA